MARAVFGTGGKRRTKADDYQKLIRAAVKELEVGPAALGVRHLDEVSAGLMSLHIGRWGRHCLIFRVTSTEEHKIEVLRIPYDQMDIARHIPPTE